MDNDTSGRRKNFSTGRHVGGETDGWEWGEGDDGQANMCRQGMELMGVFS